MNQNMVGPSEIVAINEIEASRTLHIARKLLSLWGKFHITDGAGTVLYECTSKWAWFNPPWTLTRDGKEVAVFKRKLWAFASTWNVETEDNSFTLRSKLWTFRRQISVQGGAFDGAVLTGNLFDMKFELTWHGQVLAKAHGKVLSFRARHDIVLLESAPQVELFTAILMANLLVEKGEEHDGHSAIAD